jgi:DNA invertase Pin-like site-specific DNA recombinase
MKKAIAYLRVSTTKQGVFGLGIEAQRAAIKAFCQTRDYHVVEEFVEAESGKRNNRPQLERARAYSRAIRGTLIVAKLDRLSRDVDMIRTITAGTETVAFCDFPDIPEGPIGKYMLTMIAAVAEFESGLISQRTKAGMAAGKARGAKYGNVEALQRYHATRTKAHDTDTGHEVQSQMAMTRIKDVAPEIQALRESGVVSLGALASALNSKGITAPRGGQWHKTTVHRVLRALP